MTAGSCGEEEEEERRRERARWRPELPVAQLLLTL